MLNNRTVAVVVPAYNEQDHIGKVIETMPDFVDRIIIINDGSTDQTAGTVKGLFHSTADFPTLIPCSSVTHPYENLNGVIDIGSIECDVDSSNPETGRIILLSHKINSGKGAGIKTGYLYCRYLGIDCVATMDGDGQMDPNELKSICEPVVYEGLDYVKGNRLDHKHAWQIIPMVRIWGNLILSALTKPCSGYWKITDTQTGFTAISRKALDLIPVEDIYPFYGYPNDILVKLNINNCTIREVVVRPIYHDHSKSKMKVSNVIPRISWLLFRSFFSRLWSKYKISDPVFIFYHISVAGTFAAIVGLLLFLSVIFTGGNVCGLIVFFTIPAICIAICSFLIAMFLDKQDNKRLYR